MRQRLCHPTTLFELLHSAPGCCSGEVHSDAKTTIVMTSFKGPEPDEPDTKR